MPSPIVALDLITSAMRLVGVLATSETPTAAEAVDGLAVLNDLLEQWSTERLSAWQSTTEAFTLIPGQSTYTIGPAGQFSTTRPVRIASAYTTFAGVDFPVPLIDQESYNLISIKTMQQPIVERLLYVNDHPLGRLTLWPVPSQTTTLTLSIDRVLVSPVTLTTSISGPPGYTKALRYSLAIEYAAEFGVEPSLTVQQVALESKADYKRANMVAPLLRCDDGLLSPSVVLWQRGY